VTKQEGFSSKSYTCRIALFYIKLINNKKHRVVQTRDALCLDYSQVHPRDEVDDACKSAMMI